MESVQNLKFFFRSPQYQIVLISTKQFAILETACVWEWRNYKRNIKTIGR